MLSKMRSRYFSNSSFRQVRESEQFGNAGPHFVPILRYRASQSYRCSSNEQEYGGFTSKHPNKSRITTTLISTLDTQSSPRHFSDPNTISAVESGYTSYRPLIQHLDISSSTKSTQIVVSEEVGTHHRTSIEDSADDDSQDLSSEEPEIPSFCYTPVYTSAAPCFTFTGRVNSRRMAICEEIDKLSVPVKVNGKKMSINDMRRDLIHIHCKCKTV